MCVSILYVLLLYNIVLNTSLDRSAYLTHLTESFGGIVPELLLGGGFLMLLVVELLRYLKSPGLVLSRHLNLFSLVLILVVAPAVVFQWNESVGFRFYPMLFLDNYAVFFKLLLLLLWAVALLHLRWLKYEVAPEWNALLAAMVLGMFLLSMATHLLSIYLALELVSVSSYLLVAYSPHRKAAEAGIKYLLVGAISSAVMLYGISLVYGLTGTMNITEESLRAGLLSQEPLVLYTALFMVFGGLLFKLALVPFHAWAPDVYEATPTPLVAFLSVGPKVVVLVVAMRLLSAGMTEVRPVLGVLALLSMTAGNAMALGQQQARRLLGYSSIAQAGYLLVGVLAYSTFGLEAALFYVLAYALLNIAVFVLLDLLQPHSPMLLSDYEGLGSYAPWPSIALTVALVGLAGLPPTVGFTAKWFIFSALWESYQTQGTPSWMLWLLVGGVLNAALSLVYYMRLPYLLFFRTRNPELPLPTLSLNRQIVAGLFLLLIVLAFIKPDWLTHWIAQV